MKTPASEPGQAWDLTNCEREPIHIPGVIQAHGFLVELDRDLQIRTVSENWRRYLDGSGDKPAESLLRTDFSKLLDPENREEALKLLRSGEIEKRNPFQMSLGFSKRTLFDVRAAVTPTSLILEFETADSSLTSRFYHESREAVALLRGSKTLEELFSNAAKQVRKLTGFDRVNIYKFDPDWNGHVLAEEKGEKGDSYLDLHFPASDIPRQARELYYLNRIRFIPDVMYQPSKLHSVSSEPLDLSRASLRGVSPVHVEYLKNMEATASMSISLEKENQLWGLISCTHLSGRLRVSFEARAVCELIGEIMSSLLLMRESNEVAEISRSIQNHQSTLLEAMTRTDELADSLVRSREAFLGLVNADGGVIYKDDTLHVVGQAPSEESLKTLAQWLATKEPGQVYCSENFSKDVPAVKFGHADVTGFMGFSVSKAQKTQVMWFRPEVVQSVKWGGDPTKPVDLSSGSPVLHPRKSFESWKEVVRGRSLPWRKEEVSAAQRLRNSITDVVLQKAERINALNRELERSNTELDSFAYAASHDLKEPLRGIHNYAAILSRSLNEKLSTDEKSRFETIGRLTQRMEDLINSLLSYSQVGRVEFAMRENDLNEILKAALDSVRTRVEESNVKIDCNYKLPRVVCDRVQVVEVFTNLISNAIKYNRSAQKSIRIWCEGAEDEQPIIRVADNGIGIEEENKKNIFKIFKRLHAKSEYGGGTGTGLTITAKIIERHGGRIWVESVPSEGSVFSFTLGKNHHDA